MANQKTVVSGDYVQGSFGLLPLAGERARAALHFSRLLGSTSFEENFELARWYLRAALSEFRSIFDLLNSDFKSLGLAAQWKQSPYKANLDADATVSVLRKVRDFAIHSAIIQGVPKTFTVSSSGGVGPVSRMPSIVIEPLNRNIPEMRRELSYFDDSTLSTFNDQSTHWPADLLIHIAIYRSSESIAGFLKRAISDGSPSIMETT